MNIKSLIFAAVAAATLSSGAAFAHAYDDGYRGDGYSRYHRYDRYEHYGRYDRVYRDDRYRERRAYRHHRRDGAGPYHDLYRGERLPQAYWGRHMLVRHWRRAGLPPPIYGHNWVRTGDDFVLVSVDTGIIAQVALGD
ncbi:MAG TPA: RcnB family protein [Telluria sp.]|nr:RcnB family protein [Telluria sp.]